MAAGKDSDRSAVRLVGLVCAAQVLVQLGAFFWPALLPGMMRLWMLTNSEAGWITAIFYAAYMVSVPVLVTLTDRIDARGVYLFGVACTVIGHLIFAVWAEGFWSALGARALTGYTFEDDEFIFQKNNHDDGRKSILGRTGTLHLFDFAAGCDSGFGSKPDPGMALAFCEDRSYAVPDDVQRLAPAVLAHRVLLKRGVNDFASARRAIEHLVATVAVPL